MVEPNSTVGDDFSSALKTPRKIIEIILAVQGPRVQIVVVEDGEGDSSPGSIVSKIFPTDLLLCLYVPNQRHRRSLVDPALFPRCLALYDPIV